MFKAFALAGLAAGAVAIAAPAAAATTVTFTSASPGGAVTLDPAGSGAVAGDFGFNVSGTGTFTVTFSFTNPFNPAAANGSASFNFDPDMLVFTSGSFSGGASTFIVTPGPTGSSIQVDLANLPQGAQTLTLNGTLNSPVRPIGVPGQTPPNDFARVAGTITLTGGAVPEPATWALFILGFGAIGHTMRRRSGKISVAKASLNFA